MEPFASLPLYAKRVCIINKQATNKTADKKAIQSQGCLVHEDCDQFMLRLMKILTDNCNYIPSMICTSGGFTLNMVDKSTELRRQMDNCGNDKDNFISESMKYKTKKIKVRNCLLNKVF